MFATAVNIQHTYKTNKGMQFQLVQDNRKHYLENITFLYQTIWAQTHARNETDPSAFVTLKRHTCNLMGGAYFWMGRFKRYKSIGVGYISILTLEWSRRR